MTFVFMIASVLEVGLVVAAAAIFPGHDRRRLSCDHLVRGWLRFGYTPEPGYAPLSAPVERSAPAGSARTTLLQATGRETASLPSHLA